MSEDTIANLNQGQDDGPQLPGAGVQASPPLEEPHYEVTLQQMRELGDSFKAKMRLQQEPRALLAKIIDLLRAVASD